MTSLRTLPFHFVYYLLQLYASLLQSQPIPPSARNPPEPNEQKSDDEPPPIWMAESQLAESEHAAYFAPFNLIEDYFSAPLNPAQDNTNEGLFPELPHSLSTPGSISDAGSLHLQWGQGSTISSEEPLDDSAMLTDDDGDENAGDRPYGQSMVWSPALSSNHSDMNESHAARMGSFIAHDQQESISNHHLPTNQANREIRQIDRFGVTESIQSVSSSSRRERTTLESFSVTSDQSEQPSLSDDLNRPAKRPRLGPPDYPNAVSNQAASSSSVSVPDNLFHDPP